MTFCYDGMKTAANPIEKVYFSTFSTPQKNRCVLFYLARHVVTAHLEHLQLVPNLLKLFETPSSVFVQLE